MDSYKSMDFGQSEMSDIPGESFDYTSGNKVKGNGKKINVFTEYELLGDLVISHHLIL